MFALPYIIPPKHTPHPTLAPQATNAVETHSFGTAAFRHTRPSSCGGTPQVAGRASTAALVGDVPTVVETEPWDGKDGVPIAEYEEEFDLSDLDDLDGGAEHSEL